MATLAQLRTRISRKMKDPNNTGISASAVDDEINRAIRYYSNFRFWFNEDEDTIALVAGTQTVPSIPSTLVSELRVNGLLLIDNQVKINLKKVLPDEFSNMDQDQTGRPYYYTYKDGSYYLLPTPDQAYSLKFRYTKEYADLSADGDTNDFTDNAEDLLMLHALKNIYAEDKDDPEYAARFNDLETNEYRSLLKRSGLLLGTGYLQSESIL